MISRWIEKENIGIMIAMDYHSETIDISDYRTLRQIQKMLRDIIDLYVDVEGDQSINISAPCRYEICQLEMTAHTEQSKHLPVLLSVPTTPTGSIRSEDPGAKIEIMLDEIWSETEGDEKPNDPEVDHEHRQENKMDSDHEEVKGVRHKQSEVQSVSSGVNRKEEDKQKLKEYMNKFEVAIEEVVWLLKQDCLLRFYNSDEYQQF